MNGRLEFTPAQVARMVGISPSTLKRLEAEGFIPKAKRRGLNKTRFFSEADVTEIKKFVRGNY